MTGFSPRKGLARIAGRAGGGLRMAFERLPPDVRETVRGKRAVLRGLAQLKRNQAVLARRIARLELAATTPAAVAAPDGPDRPDRPEVVDDRFPAGIRSRICTQAQLQEPWFDAWCTALGERPRAHRKLWEHAYIARVLDAHGHLAPGQQGLGFGVGREPLTALFAGRGCSIVATDLAHDAEGARVWSNTGQHAGGLAGLSRPELCDPDAFEKLVTWRPVDMRALPDDLSGFDFCWSACSLEHLGTLEAGLAFVEGSMQTLRPGGLAVHTTEYNLDSDTDTVAAGNTVLYRRADLEALVRRLEGLGHALAALDLVPGDGILDEYVDLPPYGEDSHLRAWFGRYSTTSVALVIRAGEPSAG